MKLVALAVWLAAAVVVTAAHQGLEVPIRIEAALEELAKAEERRARRGAVM